MKDLYTRGVVNLESYNIGYQDAEDRIIKLLEERSKCGYEHDYNGSCFCEEIALIKGECQKDNETVVLLTEGEK